MAAPLPGCCLTVWLQVTSPAQLNFCPMGFTVHLFCQACVAVWVQVWLKAHTEAEESRSEVTEEQPLKSEVHVCICENGSFCLKQAPRLISQGAIVLSYPIRCEWLTAQVTNRQFETRSRKQRSIKRELVWRACKRGRQMCDVVTSDVQKWHSVTTQHSEGLCVRTSTQKHPVVSESLFPWTQSMTYDLSLTGLEVLCGGG